MINNREEYIVCAAIWFDDGEKHYHQPVNIDIGIVYFGLRHGNCFQQSGAKVKERQDMGMYEKEQGFLTSKNRFVSRTEAAEIALRIGQFKDDDEMREVEKSKFLYSENIY